METDINKMLEVITVKYRNDGLHNTPHTYTITPTINANDETRTKTFTVRLDGEHSETYDNLISAIGHTMDFKKYKKDLQRLFKVDQYAIDIDGHNDGKN